MTKRRFPSWRERLQAARLYLILDPRAAPGRDPIEATLAAVRGGVDLVQVRLKRRTTSERVDFTRTLIERLGPGGPLVIVNDDPQAALLAGAHGVHLGPDDPAVDAVRKDVGDELLIGRSAHSIEEAIRAFALGADYAGLGAMFPTRTKRETVLVGPEALRDLEHRANRPVFAIGGITLFNLDQILARGCHRVAISSAILGAHDPEQAARAFRDRLRETADPGR